MPFDIKKMKTAAGMLSPATAKSAVTLSAGAQPPRFTGDTAINRDKPLPQPAKMRAEQVRESSPALDNRMQSAVLVSSMSPVAGALPRLKASGDNARFFWSSVNNGLVNAGSGISKTVDTLLPNELLGKYDFLEPIFKATERGGKQAADNLQKYVGDSKARAVMSQVIGETAAGGVNMLLAFMSGGGSAAAQLGTNGGAIMNMLNGISKSPVVWNSFLRSYGNNFEGAKQGGASNVQAFAAALTSSFGNAVIEAGSGIEKLPGKSSVRGFAEGLKQVGRTMAEEGGEEVAQGAFEKLTQKAFYDKQSPLFSLTDENAVISLPRAAKEYGMGAAVGGLLGGANTAASGMMNAGRGKVLPEYRGDVQTNTVRPDRAEAVVQPVADNKVGNKESSKEIILKLSNAIPQMSKMQPVSRMTGLEFPKSEISIVKQVGDFFRSLGNKVSRSGFGDVIINENSVKDDISHGLGRAKSATFAAVPDVIKNGVQIDYQQNWKGRGYDTYVFAAPIEVGERRSYVGVVVTKADKNRFYLHEVVNEKGEVLYLNKNTDLPFKTDASQNYDPISGKPVFKTGEPSAIKTGVTVLDGVTSDGRSPVNNTTIAQGQSGVNSQYMQNGGVNASMPPKIVNIDENTEIGYHDDNIPYAYVNAQRRGSTHIIDEGTNGFAQRTASDEWAHVQDGKYSLAYKRALQPSSVAADIAADLKNTWGVPAEIVDGYFEVNDGVQSMMSTGMASEIFDGSVLIRSGIDDEALRVSAHEAFHKYFRVDDRYAAALYDAVADGSINFGRKQTQKVVDKILKNYIGEGADLSEPRVRRKVFNELCAYISGAMNTDEAFADEIFGGCFDDWEGIKQLWRDFKSSRNGVDTHGQKGIHGNVGRNGAENGARATQAYGASREYATTDSGAGEIQRGANTEDIRTATEGFRGTQGTNAGAAGEGEARGSAREGAVEDEIKQSTGAFKHSISKGELSLKGVGGAVLEEYLNNVDIQKAAEIEDTYYRALYMTEPRPKDIRVKSEPVQVNRQQTAQKREKEKLENLQKGFEIEEYLNAADAQTANKSADIYYNSLFTAQPESPRREAKAIRIPDKNEMPSAPPAHTPITDFDKLIEMKKRGENVKSREYRIKAIRTAANEMAKSMSIPAAAKKSSIEPVMAELFGGLREDRLSEGEATRIFEDAYDKGIVVLDEYYRNYKGLKDRIRKTGVSISKSDASSIPDFEKFRKNVFGSVNITKDGVPVDTLYAELSSEYKELFSAERTHPADQLQRIAEVVKGIVKTEVSLEDYYGDKSNEMKIASRHEFDKIVERLKVEAQTVNRYEEDNVKARMRNEPQYDADTVEDAYVNSRSIQKKIEKLRQKTLLSREDEVVIRTVLNGERTAEQIIPSANHKAVMELLPLMAEKKRYDRIIMANKAHVRAKYDDIAQAATRNAGKWKDKSAGIWYNRETQLRNVRDIVGNDGEAKTVNELIFDPVQKNTTLSTRMKTELGSRVKKLNLKQKRIYDVTVSHNNIPTKIKVSESGLVQMLGEEKITQGQLMELKADTKKINAAVKTFRTIYNELFIKLNETLMTNGFAPTEFRADYFPHFEEFKPDGILRKIAAGLGIKVADDSLPTSIAGLTETFKPGKRWFANLMQRTGEITDYDALEGFERYLNGAASIIHHTGDIQRLRAFENEIRMQFSEEGARDKVKEIMLRDDSSEAGKQCDIDELLELGKSHLSNYVAALRGYTNNLAGKKHLSDRSTEQEFGRVIYDLSRKLESRVAANMVGVKVSSWITNFIPITQASASLSQKEILSAMKSTVKAYGVNDAFGEMSDFITRRRGNERLSRTAAEKIGDKLSSPMSMIDDFTANTLVRAKYSQNMKNGMDSWQALSEADKWAAGLMGDRSEGALPMVFEKRNPFAKMLTMFQVEVNNQYSYMLKDIPQQKKEKAIGAILAALMRVFLGAYIYNDVHEYFTGRRAAFDPISVINEAMGDFSGYKLPNMISAGVNAVNGKRPEFKAEKKSFSGAVANLGGNIAQDIPFVGGLLDGGRLPISSALPNVGKFLKVFDDSVDGGKKAEILLNELSKPAAYLVLPFGGGQIKKTVEGLTTYAQGGGYTKNNDGEKQLQFPIAKNGANLVKSVMFGKYATSEAKEYIDGGFKMYSPKNTRAIDTGAAAGIDKLDVTGFIKGTIGMSNKEKRQAIFKMPWTEQQKKEMDMSLIDDERVARYDSEQSFNLSILSPNSQRQAKEVVDTGISLGTYEGFKNRTGLIVADYKYGKVVSGSKKAKVEVLAAQTAKTPKQMAALMESEGYKYDVEDAKKAMNIGSYKFPIPSKDLNKGKKGKWVRKRS